MRAAARLWWRSTRSTVPRRPPTLAAQDVLRDQWGFKGITVSDHGAIKELIKHGVASDPEDAVRVALKSGINMSMSDEYYSKYLPGLVKSGKVTMAELDDATRHVLNVKYDMGLFNDPYSHLGPKDSDPQDTNAESRLHRKEAREVARESTVLLKNRLDTLPLKKSGTIAVIGALADSKRDMMGSWSAAGVADQSVTVLTGMQNALGDKGKIIYAKGANVTDDKGIVDFLNLYEKAVQVDSRSPQEMIDEAVAAAKQSDVVVAVVGEAQGMAHEASSRTDITLPQSQRALISALKATGKPLVLVLMNGRPLALVKEDQQADAILKPGLPVPKAATRLPMCCSATTTRLASCPCPSALGRADPRPTTAISTPVARTMRISQTSTPRATLTRPTARSIRLATA